MPHFIWLHQAPVRYSRILLSFLISPFIWLLSSSWLQKVAPKTWRNFFTCCNTLFVDWSICHRDYFWRMNAAFVPRCMFRSLYLNFLVLFDRIVTIISATLFDCIMASSPWKKRRFADRVTFHAANWLRLCTHNMSLYVAYDHDVVILSIVKPMRCLQPWYVWFSWDALFAMNIVQ